jgi:hypothetical protein
MSKKRVHKFSGEDKSLVKKLVPAQVRTFAGTLAGNRDPITEKDFTAAELKQAKDAVLQSRERNAKKLKDDPTVAYKDYGKNKDDAREDANIGYGTAMRNTLGRFKYEKTPEGRLVATDTYDFKDDLVKEIPGIPKTKDYAGLNTLEKVGKLAKDSFNSEAGGFKTLPSRTGSAFIGADGRPVKIDLGEAPFKRGGAVKPKRSVVKQKVAGKLATRGYGKAR